MKYIIKEHWKMADGSEYYSANRNTLKKVKEYIKDWLENWKENAEYNDYKFLTSKTDYKTFANCKIKTPYSIDYFYLKIKKQI